jgi:hypothetical protein
MDHPWEQNEWGLWCLCCGNHIARADELDDEDYKAPEMCRQCGFPDEIDPERI